MEEKNELIKKKLDPLLQNMVTQTSANVPIIIQTVDGLKDEDAKLVEKLGGKVKDNLYIINAFSAEMAADMIPELIKSDRITRVFFDSEVKAL